ncbi:hypothetical protein E4U43_008193 [Claviceps pusilla]|uniref:RAD13 n=1 Tax=Claviceps pusilla TaxID=123648 RepID=A0A9P7NB46_9HYPO|nr:hypothetical protein E4U43_008193 [Claviceps pusilla]
MGVNGLWTVVQPCARPTNLATLNRKRIAVDASIWIYQFLKAVRDKEGNALRNSHVVGFFRRICKLLWFGVQPVFVFDGGAPALKRATIQRRQRRREGRREDAVRTAGRLLAVQMQRLAAEEDERRKRADDGDFAAREALAQREEVPHESRIAYADEVGMTRTEKAQSRRFHKQDAYHLPELEGSIAAMAKPDDPRIMSVEELEEYARQFHNGQDINLYDFSKIDFDGDFFKSLPPPDRYNILNAARLRSRLRMGLSKDQLDDMFPDRMAFSRFQIERVKERNHLTQRLMHEVGMTGLDLTIGVNARVAGEKDREYILVKNDGVEGGWALGVVSKEKDIGEAHKPIDVDAIQVHYQSKQDDIDDLEDEDDADFEDIPIEGLNRLPKLQASRGHAARASAQAAHQIAERRQQYYNGRKDDDKNAANVSAAAATKDVEGSLFVDGNTGEMTALLRTKSHDPVEPNQSSRTRSEEDDDLNKAIALSLKNQHDILMNETENEEEDEPLFEDVPVEPPSWKQEAVDAPRPIIGTRGSMIAHIVNNRANAAVPRRREETAENVSNSNKNDDNSNNDSDSDDDEDNIQAILAKSRTAAQRAAPPKPKPVFENKKNPFDGPLPFPKLDWASSLFAQKSGARAKTGTPAANNDKGAREISDGHDDDDDDVNVAGGFEIQGQTAEAADAEPLPLPPWLADDSTDIRASLKRQQDVDREINAEDKMEAEAEQRLRRREMLERTIEIASSEEDDEDGSDDVEIVEDAFLRRDEEQQKNQQEQQQQEEEEQKQENQEETQEDNRDNALGVVNEVREAKLASEAAEPSSPEVTLDADVSGGTQATQPFQAPEPPQTHLESEVESPEPIFEDVPAVETTAAAPAAPTVEDDDDAFAELEYEDFSDPGDEELMTQMAQEAEEHARFTSELNNNKASAAAANHDHDYDLQLRQLRTQQKKDRRDADQVTQTMISECQALLRLFGIPYMTAPMEAEAQCAELVRLGLVDGIVTDDSDTFLFGGTRVYKNMFNSNKFVECYLGSDLEQELSLSRDQLISLAQLLGSDYTDGLPGIGPVTALEILSEFPGPSGLYHFRDWWTRVQTQPYSKQKAAAEEVQGQGQASSAFRRKFHKAHSTKLFLPPSFPNPAVREAYLHPEVDSTSEPFQWGLLDLPGLRAFLTTTIGWSQDRTDEVLVPVIRDMNRRDAEGTQSNITSYLTGSAGAGAFAPRANPARGSKRMAAAVDKLRANAGGEKRRRGNGRGGD